MIALSPLSPALNMIAGRPAPTRAGDIARPRRFGQACLRRVPNLVLSLALLLAPLPCLATILS